MTAVAKTEQATAWQLRAAWGARADVRLTLSDTAIIRTIVGKVSRVSVTGAFAIVDGWHVPCAAILAVGKPTVADKETYAAEIRRHREETAPEGA